MSDGFHKYIIFLHVDAIFTSIETDCYGFGVQLEGCSIDSSGAGREVGGNK